MLFSITFIRWVGKFVVGTNLCQYVSLPSLLTNTLDKLIFFIILTLNISRKLTPMSCEEDRRHMATANLSSRDLRRTNRATILRTLYFGGEMSRVDLSQQTQLST